MQVHFNPMGPTGLFGPKLQASRKLYAAISSGVTRLSAVAYLNFQTQELRKNAAIFCIFFSRASLINILSICCLNRALYSRF